jgi:hypothetical protein
MRLPVNICAATIRRQFRSWGPVADKALTTLKSTGRVAYPNGVHLIPKPPAGITAAAFDCDPEPKLFERLHRLVGNALFTVHVARRSHSNRQLMHSECWIPIIWESWR